MMTCYRSSLQSSILAASELVGNGLRICLHDHTENKRSRMGFESKDLERGTE